MFYCSSPWQHETVPELQRSFSDRLCKGTLAQSQVQSSNNVLHNIRCTKMRYHRSFLSAVVGINSQHYSQQTPNNLHPCCYLQSFFKILSSLFLLEHILCIFYIFFLTITFNRNRNSRELSYLVHIPLNLHMLFSITTDFSYVVN